MKLFQIVIISLVLLVNSISVAFCQDVTLSWDPSPTADVTGYKIYYKQGKMNFPFDGTGADQGSSPVDVGDVLSTTLTNLDDGATYFFSVTAYADDNQESSYSNIVSNSWIPALLLPESGATGEPVPVTFQWETAPAGYDVTYTLYYGTDRNEVSAAGATVSLPPPANDPHLPPGASTILIIMLAWLMLTKLFINNKSKFQIIPLCAVLLIGGLLTSCGGGGGGGGSSDGHSTTDAATTSAPTLYSINKGSSDYHQAFDLEGSTTYYWKVVATDTQDQNLKYESEVLQFTTEDF